MSPFFCLFVIILLVFYKYIANQWEFYFEMPNTLAALENWKNEEDWSKLLLANKYFSFITNQVGFFVIIFLDHTRYQYQNSFKNFMLLISLSK